MYHQIANTFDPTSDLYEIGLIAFASPDFADALLRELAGPTADSSRSDETTQARATA